jgi:hypothetical protein
MPLKSRLPDGSLISGPEGVELVLSHRNAETVEKGSRGHLVEKVLTGKDGIANFSEIKQSSFLNGYLEVWYNHKADATETAKRGRKNLYTFESGELGASVCTYSAIGGFSCNNDHQIVIMGTLVGGVVSA